MMLTGHLNLVSRLSMSAAKPPLPQMPSWHVYRDFNNEIKQNKEI